MLDPAAMEKLSGGLGGSPAQAGPPAHIGPCFQLALLAAGQGNDKEAGDYLRQIIASMKVIAGPRPAGA